MSIEFCTSCNISLTKGDLTIKGGKSFTSHDFICPNCKKPANPNKEIASIETLMPEDDKDMIIKDGNAEVI